MEEAIVGHIDFRQIAGDAFNPVTFEQIQKIAPDDMSLQVGDVNIFFEAPIARRKSPNFDLCDMSKVDELCNHAVNLVTIVTLYAAEHQGFKRSELVLVYWMFTDLMDRWFECAAYKPEPFTDLSEFATA